MINIFMRRIIKLDPQINPVTFKDGRGIIQTYLPEEDSIKEWNYRYPTV